MFICGNDDGAAVKEILDELGWGTIDIIATVLNAFTRASGGDCPLNDFPE